MTRRADPFGLPSSAADQSARQLDQTLRLLVSVVAEQTTVVAASLPQFYGMAELRRRWNSSEDQVTRLLSEHAGYRGARGHRVTVSLEDVLKIDQALKAEYNMRKRLAVAS